MSSTPAASAALEGDPLGVMLIPAPRGLPNHAKLFWQLHCAYWATAFVVNLLLASGFQEKKDATVFILLEVILCGIATAVIRWGVKTAGQRSQPLAALLGLILAGALVGTLLVTAVLQGVSWGAGFSSPSLTELTARMAITLAMIVHWCGLYVGYRLFRERDALAMRALEAESAALRSELDRLVAQISPHFLFNALNTVLACRNDPAAIERVTHSLAEFLRVRLRPETPLVPLAREFDAVEDFLTIQSFRFGDSLVPRIDCDIDVRSAAIPPAAIQALVENAIKYGFETAAAPIAVEVEARREGQQLVVAVSNTGAWVEPDTVRTTGTGLTTLEKRLGMLFGHGATINRDVANGRVRVVIRMPLRLIKDLALSDSTA